MIRPRLTMLLTVLLALFPAIYCRAETDVGSPSHASEGEKGDFNFDGHEDYRIHSRTNGKLSYYDHFLYHPPSKEHRLFKPLSKLYNPVPDQKQKVIRCRWLGGHSGAAYTEHEYYWQDHTIQLKRTVRQDALPAKDQTIHYVRATVDHQVDGEPQVQMELVYPFD